MCTKENIFFPALIRPASLQPAELFQIEGKLIDISSSLSSQAFITVLNS